MVRSYLVIVFKGYVLCREFSRFERNVFEVLVRFGGCRE